ncbi:HAF repeat-containing protein [Parafrankia discariae]|uniref:HAF repeat-containing protein n=1 Tax=Parafrankia discariae TaxID=365528 RepID=UPI000366194F|nr:HAF repeat-containing protein [Parafrankia discariae]
MTGTTRARVRAEALAALTALTALTTAGAIGAAAALAPPAAAASPGGFSYHGGELELVALDLPTGAVSGLATDMNDDGVVIGQVWDEAFGGSGVVWRDGVPTSIPDTIPLAVNDSGQVAGIRFPSTGPNRGFVWTDGTLTTLEPTDPGPNRYSFASAIGADGTVVGLSGTDSPMMTGGAGEPAAEEPENGPTEAGQTTAGQPGTGQTGTGEAATGSAAENGGTVSDYPGATDTRATVWRDGNAVDLGTLGGSWSSAELINGHGQVAGISATADGQQHAFLSGPGGLRDLGTLGGSYSTPVDINDRGQVVGVSETADGHGHAFLWENGRMRDLGTSAGFTESSATAINERGQVLVESHEAPAYPVEGGIGGESVQKYPAFTSAASVWTAGQLQPVTGLGGDTASPADLADDGTVIGSATTLDGVDRPWVWVDGESHDLRGPAPLQSGSVAGINRSGLLVGYLGSPNGNQVPVVWRRG